MRLLLVLLAATLSAEGQTVRDVEYARPGGEPLLLDVQIPDGEGPFPAAVLVHGGGFEAGDKQTYITYIFEPLTEAGIAWFSIDYRLSPKHQFPAATDDVEEAIRWVKRNASKYKVDADRLALIGESAGGHLVSYVGARNLTTSRVKAVVPFYGIHDFVSFAAHYRGDSAVTERFLGERKLTAETVDVFVEASPITHVSADTPPFLMIHGTKDDGVPFEQSEDMCRALEAKDVPCEIVPVDAGHGMNTWEPYTRLHGYKKALTDWLLKTL